MEVGIVWDEDQRSILVYHDGKPVMSYPSSEASFIQRDNQFHILLATCEIASSYCPKVAGLLQTAGLRERQPLFVQ